MKTRNHLRRTLLLPTLLLALLPPCACTDDICPDTAPPCPVPTVKPQPPS